MTVTNTTRYNPSDFLTEAAIIGASNAVMAQEKRGQREVCAASVLPVEANYPKDGWKVLERWGVLSLGLVDGDPLFRSVTLPLGWKVAPTEHDMWSKLLDDKGRERAAIFYKAAFYDRRAHLNVNHAVKIDREYDGTALAPYSYAVKVAGVEVFRGPQTTPGETQKENYAQRQARDDAARAPAAAYVAEHYPNHEDYAAYWD